MLTNIPGAQKMKPGYVGLPFFGTKPMLLNPKTGEALEGATTGVLVYAHHWPGISRSVYGDHQR
jgi:acetyl-CoA synthetase